MKTFLLCMLGCLLCSDCDRFSESACIARPVGDFQSIDAVLKMYFINNGHYPSTEQGLKALVHRPSGEPQPKNWIVLADSIPTDPWGQEYRYRCTNPHAAAVSEPVYQLISSGKDSQFGTEDDLVYP